MAKVELNADGTHIVITCAPEEAQALTSASIPGLRRHTGSSWRIKPTIPALTCIKDTLSRVQVGTKLAEWILLATTTFEHKVPPMGELDYLFEHKLRPYQRAGVAFLRAVGRVLLADELGLGKTVQAIAAVGSKCRPVLVVCPNSLKYQWADEITKWVQASCFGESVAVLPPKATPKRRAEAWATFATNEYCKWFVCHYEALWLMPDELGSIDWGCVIFDEAHYLKNRRARRTKSAKVLCKRADTVMLLTGTPIINRPDELWSLCNLLRPQEFRSYWRFFESYVSYVELPFGPGGRKIKKITGVKNVTTLQKAIAPFVLRRLKVDYLADLPEVIETTIRTTMPLEQARLYARIKTQVIVEIRAACAEMLIANAAVRALKLRQTATTTGHFESRDISGKLTAAVEIIANAVASGECVVAFCHFRVSVDRLWKRLRAAKISVARWHGGTHNEGLELFQQGSVDVLVCTYGVGGVGLNLQRASTMLLVELPWSPAVKAQAIGRLHRIGQKRSVNVYTLVADGTIDVHMQRVLKQKDAMTREILVMSEVLGRVLDH